MHQIWDTLIIGAGPAGLSAALMLGRCRRSVLLCDAGACRNQASYAMFGFLSRDGIAPEEFLSICHQELLAYPNIVFKNKAAKSIQGKYQQFETRLEDGKNIISKTIILATGANDEIPSIPGIMDFWGKSVFLCPYCDGWEYRDKPIAVYGQGRRGPAFALLLREWTSDIILCSDGIMEGSDEEHARLQELGIPVFCEPIARLEGKDGALERIVFKGGRICPRSALFFNASMSANTHLAQTLGCRITHRKEVEVDDNGLSSVPGVYAAGDASADIKLAIMAAASGARAGYALNKELLKEERLILK